MAKKLVVIDACVRQADSRTWRIAEPVIDALMNRYETTVFHLPTMEGIVPLNPESFHERGNGETPQWAIDCARAIAEADRILIAAPFWDMSFPAVLKAFFEQTSLYDITFADNGKECVGLCKCEKVLYITTRGMDIPTGDPREQATPYIKALSSLWGLGDVITVATSNMDYVSSKEIENRIQCAIKEGLSIAETF